MSLETNTIKTNLEAGSFKALKNVADVARQVMLGEDQEKQEKQELINIINSVHCVNEEQKKAMINVLKEQPREVSRHGSDEISDLEDDLKDLQKKQKEYDYHDDEYQALDVRIDKKRKQLKDLKFKNR